MIYADEDRIDSNGIHADPFFKPDWSPDYLECFNYVGNSACFRRKIAQECYSKKQHHYDFVLKFAERSTKIHHIRKVLLHRTARLSYEHVSAAAGWQADIAALQGRLARTGRFGEIMPLLSGDLACYTTTIRLQHNPLVSVVVLAGGSGCQEEGEAVQSISTCVATILAKSTYDHIEIVVAHRTDVPVGTIAALEKLGCKLAPCTDASDFGNAINAGISCTRGEMIVLLDQNIEVVTPNWLERMLEHFEKKHVGVVGAKLVDSTNRIQHAGIVHNRGAPLYVRQSFPQDDKEYFFSTCAVHNFTAVSSACMMFRKSIYRKIGGFSEQLGPRLSEVDFCMRVRGEGLHVVYTPHAELMQKQEHLREGDVVPAEWDLYQTTWSLDVVSDEFYNEKFLTVLPPTFEPRINPRLL
jgi:hypothetical protein